LKTATTENALSFFSVAFQKVEDMIQSSLKGNAGLKSNPKELLHTG